MCGITTGPLTAYHEVKLKYDSAFSKIRLTAGLANDFLTRSGFTFNSLKAGGGKGGDLMAFTADNSYLVKEVTILPLVFSGCWKNCCLPRLPGEGE